MAYGFYAHNNFGDILIDDSFVNMTLVERGTLYIPPEVAYRTGGYIRMSIAPQEQVFVRNLNPDQRISGDPQGSYMDVYLRNPTGSVGSGYFDYVKMRRSDTFFQTPPTSDYGLNIMTPNGSLAFTSTKGLYGNIVHTFMYRTGNVLTITMPQLTSGKKRYVSIQSFGFYKTNAIKGSFNSNIRQVTNSCFRFASDTIGYVSTMSTWNGSTSTINSMYGTSGVQAQTLYSTLPVTILDI